MKIQEKCLPCVVNQVIKTANLLGIKEKGELFKLVFSYLAKADYENVLTPELIGETYAIMKQALQSSDPYKKTRELYNTMFMNHSRELEAEIDEADDDFAAAVKYSIIGNIIDFNPIHSLSLSEIWRYFEKYKTEALAIDDTNRLKDDIRKAKRILYLGDNCGEIVLDKLLIKKIKQIHPGCEILFAVRGAPVVNDSVEADAYAVGIQDYAAIISNADNSLGTVLYRTSPRFQSVYQSADLVISKGQANYECLSTENKNIYFLLMTKCKVIADDIGAPEMKMVCKALMQSPLQ